MSKASRRASAPQSSDFAGLSLNVQIAQMQENLHAALAASSAIKDLFQTTSVLEEDYTAVLPLLNAGSTVAENQSEVICSLIAMLSDLSLGKTGIAA